MMLSLLIMCPHQLSGTAAGIAEALTENDSAAIPKINLNRFI